MDDGAADYAGVTLQTHGFGLDEVDLLAASLRELFDLAVNLRRNRGAWIIYVKAESIELFAETVQPQLLPEFAYKLQPRRTRTP